MIDIFDFIKLLFINNLKNNIVNLKNDIENIKKNINKSFIFGINYNHDIDYFIYLKNDIKFTYYKLNFYNVNNLIYLYKISNIVNNKNKLLIYDVYNNLFILKNKIYSLIDKHNENKHYNTIDNITSHIIHNIFINHIGYLDYKYNYFKNGYYYKIKNKICYYYEMLDYIIKYNNKLFINKFINNILEYIKIDIYNINKFENNNILKFLIY